MECIIKRIIYKCLFIVMLLINYINIMDRSAVYTWNTQIYESDISNENSYDLDSMFLEERIISDDSMDELILSDEEKVALAEYKKVSNLDNVVAWIYIPDTVISYPVVHKARNNEFYLKHNSINKPSKKGAIFLDGFNKLTNFSLIHGHNLRSGELFGSLKYYKDEQYAKKHNKIIIAKEQGVFTYNLISVFILDGKKETISTDFINNEEISDYIKELIYRSKFKVTNDLTNISDVVILNTCTYEFSNAHLIVVAGKGDV